jgi:hypothetical protein
VLFDMGDFIDDYATEEDLRNDLGMFFTVLFDLDSKRCVAQLTRAVEPLRHT